MVQDERLVFVNGALMTMVGYSEEELLGHSVEEFVAPVYIAVVIARHRERMSGRDVVSVRILPPLQGQQHKGSCDDECRYLNIPRRLGYCDVP